ncbi:MAG: acyl-CoA dehydrogenase [Rhodospirillaceae bacterium]|jgi:alkylation response protein AidB-like acyl-CoA dehydrogenase|nr:acyl-CoA dehydrogenase [Rhodospirillaceae bacterium]MBT6119083.1 acyl-CoA dehydrogenase [Rhodospirillaceae bacterium]
MDFSEPEHLELLRDTVHRFAERELPRETVRRWDAEDRFPRETFDKLAALGLTGLTVPEEYGGAGRDILGAMVVIEELARHSLVMAVAFIDCACYGGMNIGDVGSEAQKAELLPRIARGEILFAYGLTEPDAASDLASVTTRAAREGDEVVIDGTKRFCTAAKEAEYIYTLVRSGPAEARYENLSFVLVPSDAAGLTMTHIPTMGLRGVPSYDVAFEGVRIPAANIIGGEAGWNRGWPMLAGPALDVEKLEVAALGLGVAQAAVEDAWTYAEERIQFGKPIARYQSIRHILAECRTRLHAARLVLYQAAWLAGEGLPCGIESSMAKLYATEAAKEIALAGQTVMSAYGYATEYDMERYVRDALLLPIIGGTSAIQRNNIANRLKLPR